MCWSKSGCFQRKTCDLRGSQGELSQLPAMWLSFGNGDAAPVAVNCDQKQVDA